MEHPTKDRCGRCENCVKLERVKASVLKCSAPAGPGIGDAARIVWNDMLKALPCLRPQG